jgi:S1-C subfamily serine protease
MGLFPGSTGGAVVDVEGRFIGIASDALSRLSPIAIPAATVLRVAEEILSRGKVARAYLGVGVQPVKAGLIVLSVEPDTAADKSGLLVGDVLTSADQTQLKATEDLLLFLEGRRPGDKLQARIVRGGEGIELSIELGERSR